MCLAVPARVQELAGDWAMVELTGNVIRINVSLVPGVKVGDFILVHAGYALQVLDESEAKETSALLEAVYGTGSQT